ncbi:MAG: ATP-binding protein [Alphaproteobacteria bacterium]
MDDFALNMRVLAALERIAAALNRSAGDTAAAPSGAAPAASDTLPDAPDAPDATDAWLWEPAAGRLHPIPRMNAVALDLLVGIDRQRDLLLANVRQFAAGLPANNALLWGARGTGKSSLIKAVARAGAHAHPGGRPRVEIPREDIPSLPALLRLLGQKNGRFLLLCDDLSFDSSDASYKSLKAVLEGGVEGRPGNVLFCATSNRRHLMSRRMIENEDASAISAGEAGEEKISLSDRFGLWIGFHAVDQPTYLAMVSAYADRFGLDIPADRLHAQAKEWSVTRGARSGRVAWQYIQDLAGRLGQTLD